MKILSVSKLPEDVHKRLKGFIELNNGYKYVNEHWSSTINLSEDVLTLLDEIWHIEATSRSQFILALIVEALEYWSTNKYLADLRLFASRSELVRQAIISSLMRRGKQKKKERKEAESTIDVPNTLTMDNGKVWNLDNIRPME